MLLTEAALMIAQSWRDRLLQRFAPLVGGHRRAAIAGSHGLHSLGQGPNTRELDVRSDSPANSPLLPGGYETAVRPNSASFRMSAHESRARIRALRGLSEARSGEFETARATFANAATLDPYLDLTRLPTFWRLPRQAHEATVAALADASRHRDAVALTATLRTRFRPRLVPPARH
jgi:hypothetical protein